MSDAPPAGVDTSCLQRDFVFIVSFGRSGSTTLMRVLNAIDGWCIRGENHNVLYHLACACGAAHRTVAKFPKGKPGRNSPWSGQQNVDADALKSRLVDSFVNTVLAPPDTARVTGFKEIRFTDIEMTDDAFHSYIDFVMDAFPGARILYLTRDPQETAASSWWAEMDSASVKSTLRNAASRFAAAQARHPARSFRLDHADILAGEAGLAPLFGFLGERPGQKALERVLAQRVSGGTDFRRRSRAEKGAAIPLRRVNR